MDDTQPMAPTDAELDALRQANGGALNFVTFREFRVIARAVLAEWGAQRRRASDTQKDHPHSTGRDRN